jgi:hypothetical protein
VPHRRWPQRDLAGNTIDFFIHVEGKTFHLTMQIITGGHDYDLSERKLREERGKEAHRKCPLPGHFVAVISSDWRVVP